MRSFLIGVLVLLGIAAFVAYNSFFVVHQTEQAIVTEFGRPVQQVNTPGLNFLTPFIRKAVLFDKRLIDLERNPQEIIASDRKRLVVEAFARYRIIDPLLYFQTLRDEATARLRIGSSLDSSVRRVLSASTFINVVRDNREALMHQITQQVNDQSKGFGIEVIDVKIKRADLPEANSEAIFHRMVTERQREAAEFRAQGEEQLRRIKANADREVTVIKAEATSAGETIRGEGDGEKNRIFAEAFNKDPDFFAFYRSMQAYVSSLQSGDTRLVLSPDAEFFKYFNNPEGTPTGAPAAK